MESSWSVNGISMFYKHQLTCMASPVMVSKHWSSWILTLGEGVRGMMTSGAGMAETMVMNSIWASQMPTSIVYGVGDVFVIVTMISPLSSGVNVHSCVRREWLIFNQERTVMRSMLIERALQQ